MGIFHRWQVVFLPPLMFMAAFNFAAIALLVSTRIAQMEYFLFYFAGFVLPAQFICGTFFPVSRFPEAIQIFAWAIPFTSYVDISRSLMLGTPARAPVLEMLYPGTGDFHRTRQAPCEVEYAVSCTRKPYER